MKFEGISKTETANGKPVIIHGISTGKVSVRTKFSEAKYKGVRAVLDIFFDKKFTEWMPIWVWVIEHPEGIFLVDTGSNSKVNNSDYLKSSGWFSNYINRRWFKFSVEKNDEIESQLKKIGLVPDNIDTVILTHLHLDHTDGLHFFENSNVLINKIEWKKPYGHLPKLFPEWLNPDLVAMTENIFGFKGKYLTKAKDMMLIHTPGHTFGHSSVLFKADKNWILFAGDVCYYEKQIWENVFSGANIDYKRADDTYQKIKQLCTTNNVIILPSHDKDAVYRLKNNIFSVKAIKLAGEEHQQGQKEHQ